MYIRRNKWDIADASWHELTRQLEYKAAWNGRKYIKINTFYVSSQLCSACGYQNEKTKDLSVREWACPVCGARHDRDVNAAKNILAEGLRLLSVQAKSARVGTAQSYACGDGGCEVDDTGIS